MARRRRNRNRPSYSPEEQTQRENVGSTSQATEQGSGKSGKEGTELITKKVILTVIIAIFVIFELSMFIIFGAGEEIHWKKELVSIERIYERGEFDEASRELEGFGDRWPGAKDTFGWNNKMGEYAAKAERWEVAADHYLRASQIDPERDKVHALAGEALWKSGQKEKALAILQEELKEFSSATGDHDRANYYLGLYLFEQERYVEAFQHFQAIVDREQWQDELAPIYARVNDELLEPVRQEVQQSTDS